MKEYMLVAKGHREIWDKVSDEEWDQVMTGFGNWIGQLKEQKLWVRSGRLTSNRVDLFNENKNLKIIDGPFTETKELTGFFIFNAEDMKSAVEISKACPSLLHDSLSLYELEGRPS